VNLTVQYRTLLALRRVTRTLSYAEGAPSSGFEIGNSKIYT
jgi:hypothetical protein